MGWQVLHSIMAVLYELLIVASKRIAVLALNRCYDCDANSPGCKGECEIRKSTVWSFREDRWLKGMFGDAPVAGVAFDYGGALRAADCHVRALRGHLRRFGQAEDTGAPPWPQLPPTLKRPFFLVFFCITLETFPEKALEHISQKLFVKLFGKSRFPSAKRLYKLCL